LLGALLSANKLVQLLLLLLMPHTGCQDRCKLLNALMPRAVRLVEVQWMEGVSSCAWRQPFECLWQYAGMTDVLDAGDAVNMQFQGCY
jgi:hypothetical protein